MTSKDIMIQSDDAGGIIVLRSGDDEKFLKRTTKNSVRCSGIMASALKVMRDDIIELQGFAIPPGRQGKPLAKKKGAA